MDFFASTYNNRSEGGHSDTHRESPRPSPPRRSQSISFPHYCPQQQGYGHQSDPFLRRTCQGLRESSLSPMTEEPTAQPGFSENCQFDSATLRLPRSPPPRRTSHHLAHFNTVPDLSEYRRMSEDQRGFDSNGGGQNSQRHATYVSNPCLSHHINASGYGSVQPPSGLGRRVMVGAHRKSYSHLGVQDPQGMPPSAIPTPDDCVPQNSGTGTKATKGTEEEACRLRNSQQMLQDADATVSSKGRLFPTSQHVQHLHQYLRKLHEDVKHNAAILMGHGGQQGGSGNTTSSPSSSPSPMSHSPSSHDPLTRGLAVPEVITRTPSPVTVQAIEKIGSTDLPDSTQDIYAAQASPAESYTLQRRISQYGYSDPTLLAKLSLHEGEPDHCVRIQDNNDQLGGRHPYSVNSDQQYLSAGPPPQLDSGARSPRSPFLDVATTAVRDRLQHSSYAVGSPTLTSPPFSPLLSGREDSASGVRSRDDTPLTLPLPELARPSIDYSRRKPSYTGYSEGPGMELYPTQAGH
ncbi:hypothetical protein BGZ73_006110 [Actinomortierella ambigua]|nr:hypothetical protein BGZ73_006110 [Actinomortierella ambigua]